MDFSEKLKMLRVQQGLTLEEVGNRVGVGKSTVRKWESGQIANMRRDKIAKLAQALGTTPSYLMGWDEPETPIPAPPALTPPETELLTIYNNLNPIGQTALMATARGLNADPDMQKSGASARMA